MVWGWRCLLLGAAFAGAQGCGGGGSNPSVSSGLPKEASVSGLSETDQAQLCEATAEAAASVVDEGSICTLLGAVAAITFSETTDQVTVDRATCEAARDECLNEDTVVETTEEQCSPDEVMSTLENCQATVGEVEACLSAQLRLVQSVVSRLNCGATITMDDIQDFEASQDPAECEGLDQTCPGLFSDTDFIGDTGTTATGGSEPSATGCDETCFFSDDGECDDGGEGSVTSACGLGTDCMDCGQR